MKKCAQQSKKHGLTKNELHTASFGGSKLLGASLAGGSGQVTRRRRFFPDCATSGLSLTAKPTAETFKRDLERVCMQAHGN
jgi:hypothetical protein